MLQDPRTGVKTSSTVTLGSFPNFPQSSVSNLEWDVKSSHLHRVTLSLTIIAMKHSAFSLAHTEYMLALKTCAVYNRKGKVLGMGIQLKANTVPALLEAQVRNPSRILRTTQQGTGDDGGRVRGVGDNGETSYYFIWTGQASPRKQ